MDDNKSELKTDPGFMRLIQPIDDETKKIITDMLIEDDSSRVIHLWQNIHLNDFEKYEICVAKGLPVRFVNDDFSSYNEAGSYICSEQLKRHDLTVEFRKYLIGQKYCFEDEFLKETDPDKPSSKSRLAFKIGEELNIVGGTVLKYNVYSNAINSIFDMSEPLARSILMGKLWVSHDNVIELSRLLPDEINILTKSVLEEGIDHLTFPDIRHEVKWRYTQTKGPVSRREKIEQKCRLNAGIRQMPAYNPDAEVNSLCMTIGSWVSSIERVNRSVNYESITRRATLELMKQLTILERTINTMQKALVERNPNDK